MSGCFGSAVYYPVEDEALRVGYRSVDVERLLDRNLGEGTIVKVTVEVLHEEPMPTACINPWSGHYVRAKKDGYLPYSGCIGDGA